MTTSITSSTPGLCDNCQQIDFSLFMPYAHLEFPDTFGCYGEENWPFNTWIRDPHGWLITEQVFHKLDLGPLKAIVARQEVCLFCHFVATTFKKSYGREVSSLPAVSSHEGTCKIVLRRLRFGTVFNYTQSLPYRFKWPEGWKVPYMHLSCWSKGEMETHDAFLAAPPFRSTSEPTLLARYQPAQCDVALFKSWLQICVTSHSRCCRKRGNTTVPLRLIDVVKMCLVTFAGRKKAKVKYFALSYVWGGGPKEFVLTSENLQEYCRPHGLPILPKTISDAVKLTERMGKRYLWVDSLCIVSNDPEDKKSQIPAMTSVYGNAMLTIIAAAGEDATYGLPGLDSFRPDYKVANLGRYQIVKSRLSAYERAIKTTTWATRAWTYQELLLSARLLIFLETHVEWLCKCTEWHEELDFEHPKFTFPRYWQFGTDLGLNIGNYGTLVYEYTTRNLTFETDIVDAFAGVMAAIDDDELFWGIPHSRFCEWLVWDVAKVPPETISGQRRDCGLSIPSWSWLSWRGVIIIRDPESNSPSSDMYQPLLAVYRWRSGQLEQICAPELIEPYSSYYRMQQRVDAIWRNESDWTVRIDDLPSDITLNENQLIFWAPTLAHSTQEGCDHVMVGYDTFGAVLALEVMWSDQIASRLGTIRFEVGDHGQFERAPKKLIIMQ